jgi:phage replication O-like protein O
MANPQAENGHIDIANEIAEALMKVNLSPYESRVLWFVFRKTYGWNKKEDWISLSQFSKEIGIDRRLVHRAIKALSYKKMIVIRRDDRGNPTYGFQKDYEKWELSSKKMTVICRDDALSSKKMMKVSSVEIPTKDKVQKKSLQKKTPIVPPEWIPFSVWNDFYEHRISIGKFSTRAQELIIEKLDELRFSGQDPCKVINQSIASGWKGVFELKRGGRNGAVFKRNNSSGTEKTGGARSDENPYPVDLEC